MALHSHFLSPGEHAEESVDDLSREGNAHLDSQRLKQRQEKGQHLICHIWERELMIIEAGQSLYCLQKSCVLIVLNQSSSV